MDIRKTIKNIFVSLLECLIFLNPRGHSTNSKCWINKSRGLIRSITVAAGKIKRLRFTLLLAGSYVFLSVFHFWPFAGSALWRMCNPVNITAGVWFGIVLVEALIKKRKVKLIWPDVSVFCFVLMNIFSAAFTDNWSRTIPFIFKLITNLILGFVVLASSIKNKGDLKFIFKVIVAAAGITVAAPVIIGGYVFFENAYKYVSYCSILVVLGSGYLIAKSRIRNCHVGLRPPRNNIFKFLSTTSPLIMVPLVLMCFYNTDGIRFTENDGVNLRQGYIEWQTFMNVSEKMGAIGCGAGCINDVRSSFYYKLPKLNTVNVFNQNGWLCILAETGIVGLICWVWIFVRYFKKAYFAFKNGEKELAMVCMAGLACVCVVHIFSSVLFNGVLVGLVVVLALIESVERVSSDENII